jgi:hypothetical protein
LAGKNPTSAAVIKDLRGIKAYNANGILPDTINFSTIFGHNLPKSCGWYMQAQKNGFKATTTAPVCSGYLPHSNTA